MHIPGSKVGWVAATLTLLTALRGQEPAPGFEPLYAEAIARERAG